MSPRSKGKSDLLRLGSGPYTFARTAVEYARTHFWVTVRERCPAVLSALRDDVLPVYQRTLAERGEASGLPHSFTQMEAAAPALAHAIERWAAKFGIRGRAEPPRVRPEHPEPAEDSDSQPARRRSGRKRVIPVSEQWLEIACRESHWPLQWALELVEFWTSSERGRVMAAEEPPQFPHPVAFTGAVGRPARFEIVLYPWWGAESRREFSARAHRRLDQLLRTYLDGCESNPAHAAERTPLKTNRDHFAWLVDFQIRGRSLNSIARHITRDPTAVSKGIHSIADRIGLALRPRRRRRSNRGPQARSRRRAT